MSGGASSIGQMRGPLVVGEVTVLAVEDNRGMEED
jgi:hypothetical protein